MSKDDPDYRRAARWLLAAILLTPLSIFVALINRSLSTLLALGQIAAGAASFRYYLLYAFKRISSKEKSFNRLSTGERVEAIFLALIAAVFGAGGAFVIWLADHVASLNWGAAWGRPLRLRGRVLHPELRVGSDWTRGARPEVHDLDEATRAALEALWLHDAQKEHASVPAFARISWLLAAIGAPAELIEWSHRAALEEIDHARRCFALAAGYGGRSHSVEPMPDLLLGGLDLRGGPLETLAVESLTDGCLLEDFNADIAAACAAACQESAVKDVFDRIAREERSHADFSWALLQWLLARGDRGVRSKVAKAAVSFDRMPRPTAVSGANFALVARANAATMRAHGRIADDVWGEHWVARVAATRKRVEELLSPWAEGAVHFASAPSEHQPTLIARHTRRGDVPHEGPLAAPCQAR